MASTPPPFTIEALDSQSTGTRVVFEWRGDRYAHKIYAICLGEASLLAESIEGDAVTAWPPSPPLQQLHKQSRETGGEVLFATGMAGKSHWSGSVSTAIEERAVTFEFACRHRTQPDWLGVSYRLAENILAEPPGDGEEIVLKLSDSLDGHAHTGAKPVSIVTKSIATSIVSFSGGTLNIAAIESQHMNTATTNRWAYSVYLTRP